MKRGGQKSSFAGATSRDVADALDIAQSTVSRAFTPGASISPALRDRIHMMARQIGYRPNLLARGLIAGRSKLIALVIARQTNLLYPELLYELSGRLSEGGYQVLLFPAEDSVGVDRAIERILAYRVDAVLSTGVIDEAHARAIIRHDLPLVMFNRTFDLPISSVSCDFTAGAHELTARLVAAGHREIGLIGGPIGSYVGGEVARGMRTAVAASSGVSLINVNTAYSYESGAEAIDQFMARKDGIPSAIMCVNDTVAAGCLDRVRGPMRRRVPEQHSIVTFAGFGPASWESYRLTGMRQPIEQMTGAAANIILEILQNPNRSPERRNLLPCFVPGATARIV